MILNAIGRDDYDVVVIGSGPAGITAALRIAERSAARVLVVESGGLDYDERTQQLSDVVGGGDLGSAHFNIHSQRRLGGTSSIWAGYCATLEERAFRAGQWPIDYDELDKYYPEAAEILDVSPNAYLYRSAPLEESEALYYKPFYLSHTVRFGSKYRPTLSNHPTVDLVLNKTCTRLLADGETVVEAEFVDSVKPAATPVAVKASQFVLACGGIGNPRLMQLSQIAEHSPVGRNLMEHPHIYAASQLYLDVDKLRRQIPEQERVVHAFQLTDEECSEHDLLSFSVAFDLNAVEERALLASNRRLALTDVTIRAEMMPQYQNAVGLSEQIDALGQPRGRVDFQFDYDRLAHKSWQRFLRALIRSGLGRPGVLNPQYRVAGGGHFIGTTGMGGSAEESVVDRNCRVHTTPNLYVAGSSVFPAGGVANPTFSIVALSLRLGDHIAEQFGGGYGG